MLKFWGKFYCLKRDYFVLEGELPHVEEDSQDREQEP